MDIRIFVLLIITVVVLANEKETVCEGFQMKLKCKNGGTLKIVDAMYGRQKKGVCNDKHTDSISCSYGKAKKMVKEACEGTDKCKIDVGNAFFGMDPCPDTSKYLEVKYRCEGSE